MPSKPQPYHFSTAQYSDLMVPYHFLVPIHSCSTLSQRTPRSDKHVRVITPILCPHSPRVVALCSSFFACTQSVRDETRSGGLHFNDVVQPVTVDGLPFAGVGESGCTSSHTHIIQVDDDNTSLVDGYQTLKYSYDEFTYLRSSVDIPLA